MTSHVPPYVINCLRTAIVELDLTTVRLILGYPGLDLSQIPVLQNLCRGYQTRDPEILDLARILIEAKADVNQSDGDGNLPLFLAIRTRNWTVSPRRWDSRVASPRDLGPYERLDLSTVGYSTDRLSGSVVRSVWMKMTTIEMNPRIQLMTET